MSVTSRLDAVLRVRRAQEGAAQGDLARANAEVGRARRRTALRAASMDGWAGPEGGDPTAYVAAVAAGRALAVALSTATAEEDTARTEALVNQDHLRAAAQRRRSVEKLVERTAEQNRVEALAAEQSAVDDIAGTRRGRSTR